MPVPPNLAAITSQRISHIYTQSNYAFLPAPNFHSGMKYVAPIRKDLGWRTIFNLLGPLSNPVERIIEARVIGVAQKDIGPVFAEALKIQGARKALIVCGAEDLDEISCAGKTYCWKLGSTCDSPGNTLGDITIENFTLSPLDFGLPSHSLESVSPGKEPHENAEILMKILQNQMPPDDPILHFVLMNVSALLVISGICEADSSHMGYGDDGIIISERGPGAGRWKEGVRRARWAIESGEAWRQWRNFVQASNSFLP